MAMDINKNLQELERKLNKIRKNLELDVEDIDDDKKN